MILITGSAGYIGSELCKKFEKLKIDYMGVDNLKYSYKYNIFNIKRFQKCCFSNETQISNIIKKFNIKCVIHTAAFAYVNDAEKNKKKYYLNNISKTKKFIKLIIRENVKNFIFLSSSNVYSENKIVFLENGKTNPKNFYGRTKLVIEKFLIKEKKKFNNLLILRLFNIIGLTKKFKPKNFENFRYQRILFKIFLKIKKNLPITINYINKKRGKYNFPSRDFLDIRDLVNLIPLLLRSFKKSNNFSIYNVGSGKSKSLSKILDILKKTSITVQYKKISTKEYTNTNASIKKLNKKFKWTPKVSFLNSIRSYKKYLIL